MTEKRFYYSIYNLNEDDEYYEIIDKEERYSFNFIQDEGLASQVCSCLNEQQATIDEQKIIIEERDVANERLIRFLIEMGLEKEYIKWEFKRCVE